VKETDRSTWTWENLSRKFPDDDIEYHIVHLARLQRLEFAGAQYGLFVYAIVCVVNS